MKLSALTAIADGLPNDSISWLLPCQRLEKMRAKPLYKKALKMIVKNQFLAGQTDR